MKKKIMRVAVLLLVIGAFTYFALNLNKGETSTGLGDKAAAFTLDDIDGKKQSLSDYVGQVVVLNFFATWCGPCVDEAPELEAFDQAYGDKYKLLIIDLGETRDRVKKFAKEHKTNSIYLFDYKMEVKKQFGVTGQPETFVIDKEGVIREHYKGPLTKDGLFDLVKKYK
ncbi:TlpA family protein disulfide reductase [Bacillus sp. T33-2]|uniref:TlpA family protein disulfide reductase n=1 Tax=Bacillus sp. T33-2 TaxID=2054168 RepID=UPI000C77F931|nr:TlpA disulfide reductase family protein [Bacillus sp. T33-2]PLR99895.1 TlpA family protein disulfide reductase [Bacillus sp. T33-2]